MDVSFEQKVRERAYEIWIAAGQTDGMAHEHWFEAEQAVKGEAKAKPAAKKAAKAAGASKGAKKPAAKAASKASSKVVIAKAAKAKPASELRH